MVIYTAIPVSPANHNSKAQAVEWKDNFISMVTTLAHNGQPMLLNWLQFPVQGCKQVNCSATTACHDSRVILFQEWRQLCPDQFNFLQYQMNPSFGTSGAERTPSSQYHPLQQFGSTANPLYKVQVSPISSPTHVTAQSSYRQSSKAQEELNPHSKAAFSTAVGPAKSTNAFSGLSSFARQVKEVVEEKDKPETQNSVGFNNLDKYAGMYSKYSATHPKDQKMASSAIFGNNNQESEFNRFPAFNLGFNQSTSQSSHSSSTSSAASEGGDVRPPETPKEKRERELMEIKKQLDELNKKMMMNSDKNKNIPNNNLTPQEHRPAKSAAVSQSAIFQSSFAHGANNNQPKSAGHSNLSIEQLYQQKKQGQSVKQQAGKDAFLTPKHPVPYSTQPKPTTFTDWQTFNPTRNYEADKKIEDYRLNTPQSNLSSISKPEPFSTNSYKLDYGTNSNNLVIGHAQSGSTKVEPYNYSSTFQNLTQNYGGMDTKSYQLSPTGQTKTTMPPPKHIEFPQPKQQNYNFVKAAEFASDVYGQTKQDSEAGGFKKKKAPVGDYVEAKKTTVDMKQPVVHPETSTGREVHPSHMKRTESLDYQDYSMPVPQFREIKISDFAIGKKMGKGQFGQVMLVRHKATGWVCGLKVMNKKQIKDQDYVGQIARELSIQFYLSHRNITQLYGYFSDEKNFYLLIEFCTGGQLLQKLKQEHRMSERDVSLIIRQVSEGLDYIHKELIIHRDIKPENILFNHGVAKICDFGWAVYRGFGMRKTASGSPLYYPPEIVKGESYDDKIDIWCIGMMTYECILGKIPFRVYTQMDLGRIVSDQITFPSWVDVTDEAKDFILKTLKKKGDERMEIKQILRHPFITKHQEKELSPGILEEFKRILG